MRLVIHAGFHKTGTTSVQTALADNAAILAPHVRVLLRDDVTAMIEAARGYSLHRRPRHRQSVEDAAQALFGTLDRDDPRPVLISSEDLSGFMPGRREVVDYGAVPEIMRAMETAARSALGASLDLTLYFSTRQPRKWVKSLWWQNLRNTRLDMDLPRYRRKAERIADLDAVVSAVQAVVACPVEAVSLDITQDLPQGPLAPLTELIDLPEPARAALVFGPPANRRPDIGLERVFLELNRSGLADDVVARTKTTLLREARDMAGTTPGINKETTG